MKTNQTSTSAWANYFEQQKQAGLARQMPKFQNWQGDNWLFVADWSDNYSWADGFFECDFSYPASVMWDNMNDLVVSKQSI
jgi:hypothetical protein